MADQNITNSPVTTQIGSKNPTNSGVSPIKIIGNPKKTKAQLKQEAIDNTPVNPYEVAKSRDVLAGMVSAKGYNETYVNNPYGSDYFKNRWMGIEFDPVSNTTQDFAGGINPFSENYDFEHLRRESQGTLAAAGNIATQFIGKTVVNTAGSIIAGFYGLGAGIVQGVKNLGIDDDKQPSALSKLWDNSVARSFDDATDWVDKNNTVFTSEQARESQGALNVFNVEGAKNLSDGFSFVAGAVLSEVLMAWATGGVGNVAKSTTWGSKLGSIANKGSRITAEAYGKLLTGANKGSSLYERGQAIKRAASLSDELLDMARLSNVDDLAKLEKNLPNGMSLSDLQKLSKVETFIGSIPSNARSVVTGTFWEAGLEARQAKDEFYENNMEKARGDIALMTHLPEEEKQRLLAEKEKALRIMSDDVGNGVFSMNVGVLQASNMIQFPSLFGKIKTTNPDRFGGKSILGKKLLSSSYKQSGETLSDAMYSLRKGAKAKLVAKSFASILKNPLTEGLEEMTQSAISGLVTSYYEDVLNNPFQDHLLNGANADFASEFGRTLSLVGKQLGDTFTDEEAYKEGVIGAIMGSVGAPMFRKNKNGKIRPAIVGGVWDDVRQVKSNINELNQNLVQLNNQSGDLTSILGMNKDQAIINKKLSEKDDLANLTGQQRLLHDTQEQRISNYVSRMKKLGLETQMNETFDAINQANIEEYRAMFGKDEAFTEQEMIEDKQRYKDAMDRYSNAYDTIYEYMNIDSYAEDPTTVKMIDVLVDAIGYEKYSKQKDQVLVNKLAQSEIASRMGLSSKTIQDMINNSAEFHGVKAEYDKIITELSNNKRNELKSNIEALAQESENYLMTLPAELKKPASNLVQALESEDQGAIDEANETIQNIVKANNSAVSQNEINQTLSQIVNNSKLAKSNQNLLGNQKLIEEWATSEDPEKVKEAKKVLEKVRQRLNDTIIENHKKDKENFIKQRDNDAKTFTASEMLKYLENDALFRQIQSEVSQGLDDSDLDQLLVDDYMNIQEIKNELLFSANKRLSTTQLAKEMLEMGGYKAYNKIQIDTYNYGLRNLNAAIADATFARANNDENDIVFNASRIQSALDKLEQIKSELIEKKGADESDFNPSAPLIKRAKDMLDLLSDYIAKADIQDAAEIQGQQNLEEQKTAEAFANPNQTEELNIGIPIDVQSQSEIAKGTATKADNTKIDESGVATDNIPGREELSAPSINSQNATILDPKMMFTISGKIDSVNNRDIRATENNDEKDTLRYKIDVQGKDQIRYNQGGTLVIPDLDPIESLSGNELVSYENAIFNSKDPQVNQANKESYLRGLEKLKEEDAVNTYLSETNIDNMDPDVKFYISRTRVVTNFYDKKVSLSDIDSENPQVLRITENDEPIHSMYLFAAQLNASPEELDEARSIRDAEVSDADNTYLAAVQEANTNITDLLELSEKLERLRVDRDILVNSAELKYQHRTQALNDLANFSLRLNAIKAKKFGQETKFRVGNFLNGTLPKALGSEFADDSILVEAYSLTEGENALFNESDPFEPGKLAMVNEKGELISFETNELMKTNEGSLVEKDYLSSGKLYAIVTTNNGQKVPVKINTERFDSPLLNEQILEEIKQIIKDYTELEIINKESKNQPIKLADDTLFQYAKGMSYNDFFSSISRQWKSSSASISGTMGGFINIKGDDGKLYIGGEALDNSIPDSDEVKENRLNEAIASLGRNRFYVNKNILYQNKGGKRTLNQEYLDFLMNNGIISHTLETSKLQDRIFERSENNPVKFQIHLLNDGMQKIGEMNKSKKINSFNQKRNLVHKLLFGKALGKDDKLKDTVSLNNLMKGVLDYLSGKVAKEVTANQDMNDAQKLETINRLIDDTIKSKLDIINNLLVTNPELSTPTLLKWLKANGSKQSLFKYSPAKAANYLELYTYHFLHYLNGIKGNQVNLDAIITYGSNIKYSTQVRKDLLNEENNPVVLQNTTQIDTLHNGKEGKRYVPVTGPLDVSDATSLDYQITKINSEINSLEIKANSLKQGAEYESAVNELNTKKERVEDLKNQKIQQTKDLISHVLTIGNTIETVYQVEKYYGNTDSEIPNFQFNHKKKDPFNKTHNNQYLIGEDGSPVKKFTSGSSFNLEDGSLYINKQKSPFVLEIRMPDNSFLNTTDISNFKHIKFDEFGNPINATLLANMVRMYSTKELAKIKEENDRQSDPKKRNNFKYTFVQNPLIIGSEMNKNYFNSISEIALPGINSDLSIDKSVTENFNNLIVRFKGAYNDFSKLANPVKEDKEVIPENEFGAIGASKSIDSNPKEVESNNKSVTVPTIMSADQIDLSARISSPQVVKTESGETFIIPAKPKEFSIPNAIPSDLFGIPGEMIEPKAESKTSAKDLGFEDDFEGIPNDLNANPNQEVVKIPNKQENQSSDIVMLQNAAFQYESIVEGVSGIDDLVEETFDDVFNGSLNYIPKNGNELITFLNIIKSKGDVENEYPTLKEKFINLAISKNIISNRNEIDDTLC